eukprot:s978_g4.t1
MLLELPGLAVPPRPVAGRHAPWRPPALWGSWQAPGVAVAAVAARTFAVKRKAGAAWAQPAEGEVEQLLDVSCAQQIPCIDGRGLQWGELDRTQPLRLRGLTDAWPLRQLSFEAFVQGQDGHAAETFRVRRAEGLHEYGYAGPSCGQVWGRKAWFLLPPAAAQPASRAPWHLLKDPPKELRLCVVEPGEVLFVPEGWWHSTWNLEDQIAVGWEAEDEEEFSAELAAIVDGDLSRLQKSLLRSRSASVGALPMLEAAARSGELEILRWTVQGPSPKEAPSVAIAAARTGQLEILKFLWTLQGCDTMLLHRMWWLPGLLPMGTTACHEAASCGHRDVVQWLLDQQADPSALDSRRCSPVHLAAIHGHVEVLQALAAVADLDQRHVNSSSALHQAAFGGHLAAVELLLDGENGCDGCDALGQTALHYAAWRGDSEVIALLLRRGAAINARDQQGRSPLHACVQGLSDSDALSSVLVPLAATPPPLRDQNLQAVALLLDFKADVEAEDHHGQTAYDLACRAQHQKVAELLRTKRRQVTAGRLQETLAPCYRSEVARRTQDPRFGNAVVTAAQVSHGVAEQDFIITIQDWNRLGESKVLGEVVMNFNELWKAAGERNLKMPLCKREGPRLKGMLRYTYAQIKRHRQTLTVRDARKTFSGTFARLGSRMGSTTFGSMGRSFSRTFSRSFSSVKERSGGSPESKDQRSSSHGSAFGSEEPRSSHFPSESKDSARRTRKSHMMLKDQRSSSHGSALGSKEQRSSQYPSESKDTLARRTQVASKEHAFSSEFSSAASEGESREENYRRGTQRSYASQVSKSSSRSTQRKRTGKSIARMTTGGLGGLTQTDKTLFFGPAVGQVSVQEMILDRTYTFLDYVRGGLELRTMLGIDFTRSNMDVTNPDSLHSQCEKGLATAYEDAICNLGQVLRSYDTSNEYFVYGFGAKIPPSHTVCSNCFALTGDFLYPKAGGNPKTLVDRFGKAFIPVAQEAEEKEKATLIKSRGPHLAGGDKENRSDQRCAMEKWMKGLIGSFYDPAICAYQVSMSHGPERTVIAPAPQGAAEDSNESLGAHAASFDVVAEREACWETCNVPQLKPED